MQPYIWQAVCSFQLLIIQMNQQGDWQKVIEWQQSENTYIVHMLINQQQLSIEIEDKFSGDIWQNIFTPNGIQDLTGKAKNPKKYPIFIKMLTSAFLMSSQSLKAEILSYKEVCGKYGRSNVQQKAQNPEQNLKRFIILSYTGEFEKMNFPLPLVYSNQATPERLKLTIKRLAQQLHLLREGETQSEISNQIALLKYENQSLKNKLKSQSKGQNSSFLSPKVEQLQKDSSEKQSIISLLQQKLEESEQRLKQSAIKMKASSQKIKELQALLKQSQKQRTSYNKNLNFYDQKLETLMVQMKNLHDQLVNARLKEQKNEQQIENLQVQLQKMMTNKKVNQKHYSNLRDNSSSDKNSQRSLSVKSGRSNNSQKSLGKTRNINRQTYNTYLQQQSHLTSSNSKKQLSSKKQTIYDSDTQSSRMRRMANGRNSPYRQTTNPVNKKNQKLINQINKSRSKSKEKERRITPKQSVVYSQIMTEEYQSDSQREEPQRVIYESDLKKKKMVKQQKQQNCISESNTAGLKVNEKLRNLEQLIKKASQSKKHRKIEVK